MKPKITGVDISLVYDKQENRKHVSAWFFRIAQGDAVDREPTPHVLFSDASLLRAQRAQRSLMNREEKAE